MRNTASGYSQEVVTRARALQCISPWQTLYMFVRTFSQILFFPVVYSIYPSPVVVVAGMLIIGARQASLYEINHEAAHYKLLRGASANKVLADIFCLIPFFHHVEVFSFVQWRRVHRLHHRYLMTDRDPNYLQRQFMKENLAPFTAAGIVVAMLKAVLGSWYGFFLGRQDYVYPNGVDFIKHRYNHLRLLLPVAGDAEMNRELLVKWSGYIAIALIIGMTGWWKPFLYFWLLPMYTTFPAILKFMDIMDHNWSDTTGSLENNSNSRTVPWLLRQFTSDLFRYYHREHHEFPLVPALNMPALHNLLTDARRNANAQGS